MRQRLVSAFVLVLVGCSGATEGSSVQSQKAEAAAARARGESGDPCAQHGWYGDGTCDSFCSELDPDCAPDDSSDVVCAAFLEASDGRCGRADNDPCRSQDPDCTPGSRPPPDPSGGSTGDPVGCLLYIERPDGVCSRPADDPCRGQDPDCSDGSSGGGGSSGGSAGGGLDCNVTKVTCQTFAPVTCPDGQVPTVVDQCYGPCVPREQCAPVACLAYIEQPDGVCSRSPYDPCIGQDPDCVTP